MVVLRDCGRNSRIILLINVVDNVCNIISSNSKLRDVKQPIEAFNIYPILKVLKIESKRVFIKKSIDSETRGSRFVASCE